MSPRRDMEITREEFDGLERRQLLILEEVRAIRQHLKTLNGHVSDILTEIGGAPARDFRDPERKSIRARLHTLENDRAAASIAQAALKAAESVRAQAWSTRQKVTLFVFASFAFVASTVSAIEGIKHLLNF